MSRDVPAKDGEGAGPALSKRLDRRSAVKLALLTALVLGGLAAARWTPLADVLTREGVADVVTRLRDSAWAPVIFVATYTAATALAIPGTVLTLAGGALFGFAWGSLYNWIAANLGANLAFLIARRLGRDAVRRVGGRRLDGVDRATREHGLEGLLALRLLPLVPFNALNFGSGLSAISWPAYAVATAVGIIPGTIVYTLFADAILEGSTEASRGALVRVLISGLLLLALVLLPALARKRGTS